MKGREDILEEAYQHIEIDNPMSIESKKKGVTMNFLNEGDPMFKNYVKADLTQMPPVKAKLRNFTEEEKEEIREKVRHIRQEREHFMNSLNTGNRFLNSLKRPTLNSRGSMLHSDS